MISTPINLCVVWDGELSMLILGIVFIVIGLLCFGRACVNWTSKLLRSLIASFLFCEFFSVGVEILIDLFFKDHMISGLLGYSLRMGVIAPYIIAVFVMIAKRIYPNERGLARICIFLATAFSVLWCVSVVNTIVSLFFS